MEQTLLGEKLKTALDLQKTDISSFIWKGNKTLDENGKYNQSEKRLIDMNQLELNTCYNHCKTMLFNKDSKNPGSYLVLDIIADQRNRCGAELFLRHIAQENSISRFSLINMINSFLEENRETFKSVKPVLSDMFSNLPEEFENLPVSLIMEGCLDRLGAVNKKHITRTFILKQGIWLTPTEAKDIEKYNDLKTLDKLSIIKENLGVKDVEILNINSKGLNYGQMRAMLNLKPNKKYLELTTLQLETLRYRVLYTLEESIRSHITSWENRMEQIEIIAEHNKFRLF